MLHPMARKTTSGVERFGGPLLLVSITAILFRELLIGRVLFFRDVHVLYFSYVAAFARALREGAWPLWDDGRAFGHPLLAVPDAMILYPTTWWNAFLPGWAAYCAFAVVHLPFAGWGMYRLSRRLGLEGPSALTAAGVFMVSGPLLSLVNVWHHYAGATWMPWVVGAALGAAESPDRRTVAIWAAAIALQIFAGSADMCAMTALVTAAFLLRAILVRRERPYALRLIAGAASAYAIAVCITAVQWMPTLEITRLSERWKFTEEMRTYWSVHPFSVLELIFPGELASLPLSTATRAALFEGRESFLQSFYLGLPAFGLVVAAVLNRRRVAMAVTALVALWALLVALGRFAPFYHIAVTVIPGIGILRYPMKAMIVVAFGWALLAGMGAETWRQGEIDGRRRRVALAVLAAASAIGLLAAGQLGSRSAMVMRFLAGEEDAWASAGTLSATAWRLGAAGVLAALCCAAMMRRGGSGRRVALTLGAASIVDLLIAHHGLNKTIPVGLVTMRPELLDSITGEPHDRVFVFDYQKLGQSERYFGRPSPFAARGEAGWDRDWALAVALREYMAPPTATPWGLEYGFDPDMHRLFPAPLAQLNYRLRDVEGTPAFDRMLRLGAVTHVMSLHTEGLQGLEPVRALQSSFVEPMYLSRVPEPLPRVRVVDGLRVADDDEALRVLLDPAFDPVHEVVLPAGTPRAPRADFMGSARVVSSRADARVVEAELSHDGYLVMSDRYDAGWRVTLDGKEAPLLRANMAFRAVALPAGRHAVQLLYRPAGLRYGMLGSALGLAALAALWSRRNRDH
jgi:hypothetical protein